MRLQTAGARRAYSILKSYEDFLKFGDKVYLQTAGVSRQEEEEWQEQ